MGFLIAIVVGLFLDRIFTSKLYRGQYSLAQTFWGFGVLGAILGITLASIYVMTVAADDNSGRGGWTLMAIRAVGVPVAVYAFVVFVGIWRSARDSSFIIKLLARYISLFYLSTAAGFAVFLSWFGLLIAIGVFFLKRRWLRKRAASSETADAEAAS